MQIFFISKTHVYLIINKKIVLFCVDLNYHSNLNLNNLKKYIFTTLDHVEKQYVAKISA